MLGFGLYSLGSGVHWVLSLGSRFKVCFLVLWRLRDCGFGSLVLAIFVHVFRLWEAEEVHGLNSGKSLLA